MIRVRAVHVLHDGLDAIRSLHVHVIHFRVQATELSGSEPKVWKKAKKLHSVQHTRLVLPLRIAQRGSHTLDRERDLILIQSISRAAFIVYTYTHAWACFAFNIFFLLGLSLCI